MDERVKRPRLERTAPKRSMSSLFGGSGGSADGQPGLGGIGDAVGRSVELGYRVVEDYIRQGQKTAEQLGSRTYGQDAMVGDVQELGMRVARYASEFMAVWFDFMERASAGGMTPGSWPPSPQPDGGAPRSAPMPTRAAAEGDGARVRVAVASPWPTEVEVELRPGAAGRQLVLQALRAVEPDKPRMDDVSFRPGSGDEPPTVRVRVAPDQPAGVYHGLLVDEETAAPAGTVSVRIPDRA